MIRFGRCNFAAVGGSVFNAEICSYMNITTGWNCFQSVLIKVSGQLPISLAETRKPLNSQKKMETGLDAAVAAVLPGIECILSLNEDATAVVAFLHGIGLLVLFLQSMVVKNILSFVPIVWFEQE